MKLLLLARAGDLQALAAEFNSDFEIENATDAPAALSMLARRQHDALVVHLGIGADPALDVLHGARKQAPDRPPGMVVVAESVELHLVVEVMRAGAYDVLLTAALQQGQLAHSVRNATLLTQLRRRTSPAK